MLVRCQACGKEEPAGLRSLDFLPERWFRVWGGPYNTSADCCSLGCVEEWALKEAA